MRKNQKPAGKAGLRKNRWLPGYNHGSKVGYPKTGFVKKRTCRHRPLTTGLRNTNKRRIRQLMLIAIPGGLRLCPWFDGGSASVASLTAALLFFEKAGSQRKDMERAAGDEDRPARLGKGIVLCSGEERGEINR